MSLTAPQVLRQALSLPPKARADIAGVLLRSLDEREDRGVEAAWTAEVQRRLAEVDSGKVKLVPWSEVLRSARAKPHSAKTAR
jgi:putative addiction module component (TIGR02574 family)